MRRCLEECSPPWKHYFLAGSPECLAALQVRFRDCEIVGARHGYFSREEEHAIVEQINALAPHFIWIGLGTPKQQEWIDRQKTQIIRGVILAVGFAFDVNAETKNDAPVWLQKMGLTWIFRILSEPRRLFGRYLRYKSLFLYYLAHDALRPPPSS